MSTEFTIIISDIQADIENIESNLSLYEETSFISRTDVIDFIDFHIIDRIEGTPQYDQLQKKLDTLKQRAEKIKYELEQININLFKQLRQDIAAGIYSGQSFIKMIDQYIGNHNGDLDPVKIGYDNLDIFINGILSEQNIVETTLELEPEMVFYQKTPARIVFEMAAKLQVNQDDIFFDLGSGLGQVPILMNLIAGVKTLGIEYEPAYCTYAQTCASQLSLSNVKFINQDARSADYSDGVIFFMYTPFGGNILKEVLEMLEKESLQRTIRVFTYGPCSTPVAQVDWLTCLNGSADNFYELYEFIS